MHPQTQAEEEAEPGAAVKEGPEVLGMIFVVERRGRDHPGACDGRCECSNRDHFDARVWERTRVGCEPREGRIA